MAASCSMPSAVSLPTAPMMAAIGPLRACAVEGAPTLPGPGAASLRAGHSCLVSIECMAPPQRMLGGRKTKTRRGARRQQIPIVMKCTVGAYHRPAAGRNQPMHDRRAGPSRPGSGAASTARGAARSRGAAAESPDRIGGTVAVQISTSMTADQRAPTAVRSAASLAPLAAALPAFLLADAARSPGKGSGSVRVCERCGR